MIGQLTADSDHLLTGNSVIFLIFIMYFYVEELIVAQFYGHLTVPSTEK